MDSQSIIPVIAIVTPFLFAAWVITMGMRSKERKRKDKHEFDKENEEFYHELAQGIRDLQRRIENLEIILRNKGK
ncbi:MAG: hypothetical protein WC129_06515 [Sphaerochaetaceae bacterium]|mgnify:CR=1 FL=1|jgi:hypothetical protein|nr:hypothetical protein [Sphaerochaetaceae bacterium]MDX9809201.1 hypothetical protein [Sphaerochaetaceae bacterium]NLV83118.1 hypothetical protein [Spirochaetales bacterium]